MMMLYTWAERVMADDESTSHSIIVLPMGHIFMMMQKFHNIMIHLKLFFFDVLTTDFNQLISRHLTKEYLHTCDDQSTIQFR
jgi:hypothetical protein